MIVRLMMLIAVVAAAGYWAMQAGLFSQQDASRVLQQQGSQLADHVKGEARKALD